MYENLIPQRITELRKQKGVSARDMSLSLGQANNYINNIENKKALPSMQAFFSICDYLGVTPREFFDDGNQNPKAMRKFIKEGGKLSDENMALILALMKKLNGKNK